MALSRCIPSVWIWYCPGMEDKDTRAKRLLRLDPDLYEKLKALAKINRRSANNEIELAIAEYVDRELQEEETV